MENTNIKIKTYMKETGKPTNGTEKEDTLVPPELPSKKVYGLMIN